MSGLQPDIEPYLDAGKKLVPAIGKKPIEGWRKKTISHAALKKHTDNIAWVLGKTDLVIDVDKRNGGLESLANLRRDLNLPLIPTVITPTGGYHIYLGKPELADTVTQIKKYPGVEFLTYGSLVTIAGSCIGNRYYDFKSDDGFTQEPIPQILLKFITRDKKRDAPVDGETPTYENLRVALLSIDPDLPYEDWIKVGMALKSFEPVKGLQLWHEWSSGSERYDEHQASSKWESLPEDSKVTFKTIFYLARNAEIDKIQADPASYFDDDDDDGKVKETKKAHDWLKNWVFLTELNRYVNVETHTMVMQSAFDTTCTKYVRPNAKGTRMSASSYVTQTGTIRVADSIGYFPQTKKLFVKRGRKIYFNNFNHNAMYIPKMDNAPEDVERCGSMFRRHLDLFCGDIKTSTILFEWICHQMQFPGIKLRWSPLLQSEEGMGKNFIQTTLNNYLNECNVGVVFPQDINGRMNGWAMGKCVNILQELKISGQNRHSIANTLKPLITDEYISVREMYLPKFDTYNVTNYIAFTNYRDALPLTKGDRRWFVIFSNFRDKQDLADKVGMGYDDYFDMLYGMVERERDPLFEFLLGHKISDTFKALNTAPMTMHKQLMISNEEGKSAAEHDNTLLVELIKGGGKTWNENVIDSQALFDLYHEECAVSETIHSRKEREWTLGTMGYMRYDTRVKLDGRRITPWVKSSLSRREVKENLEVLRNNDADDDWFRGLFNDL